jgi:hypothetical protein
VLPADASEGAVSNPQAKTTAAETKVRELTLRATPLWHLFIAHQTFIEHLYLVEIEG